MTNARKLLCGALLAVSLMTACSSTPKFEDEAGWDCSTMGNHVCGTPTT